MNAYELGMSLAFCKQGSLLKEAGILDWGRRLLGRGAKAVPKETLLAREAIPKVSPMMRRTRRLAQREEARRLVPGRALPWELAALPAAGAGIGAVAGEEGGALRGAAAGLGAAAGARFGLGRLRKATQNIRRSGRLKTMRGMGAPEAAALTQTRRKALMTTPFAQKRLGAGAALGGLGAGAGYLLGSKVRPVPEERPPMLRELISMFGLTPETQGVQPVASRLLQQQRMQGWQ